MIHHPHLMVVREEPVESASLHRRAAALLRDDFWFIGACTLAVWLMGAVAGGAVVYALVGL